MKRIIFIGLFLLFVLTSCNKEQVDYVLSKDETHYVLTGITTDDEKYEILSEYQGLPVKEISLFSYHASNMKSLVIPSSIEKIEFHLNSAIDNLENIYYQGTIDEWCGITLDTSPMKYAKSIYMLNEDEEYYHVKEVILSNNVTNIGRYQFYGFNEVTKILISASVNNIDLYAFKGCTSLQQITVEDENKQYKSVDGVLYNKDLTELIKYPACLEQKEFVVMDGITKISSSAFESSKNLENIVFPSTLKVIDSYAFMESGLKTINISYDLDELGSHAFDGCKALENVQITAKIKAAWGECFINIPSINSFTISKDILEKGSEGDTLFSEDLVIENFYYQGTFEDWIKSDIISFIKCTKNNFYLLDEKNESYLLEEAYINENVEIEKGCIFWGIGSLEKLVIGKDVKIIGNIIGNNSNLTVIKVDKENTTFDSRNDCNSVIVTATNTLILGCKTSVIPNDIEEIAESAFKDCYELRKIIIPKNIVSYGENAFRGCINLEEVYYEGTLLEWCKMFNNNDIKDNYLTTYTKRMYMLDDNNQYYELKDIIIPEEVTSLNGKMFMGYDNVENVYLHKNITCISPYSLHCENIKNIYFDGTIEDWCKIKLTDYSAPMLYAENIYFKVNGEYAPATNVVVPGTVKKVNSYQFGGFDCLETIEFEEGVEEIYPTALFDNPNLTKIILPSTIKSIELEKSLYSEELVICFRTNEIPENLKESLEGYKVITNYKE
ncbi:MAG: leucine-rich repeat protein [Bacilli bacterium]|nr:leucine-rich repeat protein [Bacilli bacterium]